MGGSTCRLSVKISLLCRLSVKIFNFCRLSINSVIFLSLVGNFFLVLSVVSNIFSPFVASRLTLFTPSINIVVYEHIGVFSRVLEKRDSGEPSF